MRHQKVKCIEAESRILIALVSFLNTQPRTERKARLPAAMLAGAYWRGLISSPWLCYPLYTSSLNLSKLSQKIPLFEQTHRQITKPA